MSVVQQLETLTTGSKTEKKCKEREADDAESYRGAPKRNYQESVLAVDSYEIW